MDTGALIDTAIAKLDTALQPLPQKSSDLLLVAAKMAGWQSDVDHYNQKSTDYRNSCYTSIRSSNRDTILQQSSTCLRGDLLLHISFLRKQVAYVGALPFITSSVASGATFSINNLIDAEMTIVNAIDANLYTSTDNLTDAKGKLLSQYRAPYWLALTKIRAARQLTFFGLMLKDLKEIAADHTNTPLIQKTLLQALGCMQTSTDAYRAVESATGASLAGKALEQAGMGLSTCKDTIWNVAHLKSRQQTTSTESGSLQGAAEK